MHQSLSALNLVVLTLLLSGCRSANSTAAGRHGFQDDAVRLIAKDVPSGASVELESANLNAVERTPESKPQSASNWGKIFRSREPLPRTDLKSANVEDAVESGSFSTGF